MAIDKRITFDVVDEAFAFVPHLEPKLKASGEVWILFVEDPDLPRSGTLIHKCEDLRDYREALEYAAKWIDDGELDTALKKFGGLTRKEYRGPVIETAALHIKKALHGG